MLRREMKRMLLGFPIVLVLCAAGARSFAATKDFCIKDAKLLFGGTIVLQPYKHWNYSLEKREANATSGASFIRNYRADPYLFSKIAIHKPHLFELIGAILNHRRLSSGYSANGFLRGGPFAQGLNVNEVKEKIISLLTQTEKFTTWWGRLLGKYDFKSFLSFFEFKLEGILSELNIGDTGRLLGGSLNSNPFFNAIKVGKSYRVRNPKNGIVKSYRLEFINYEAGIVSLNSIHWGQTWVPSDLERLVLPVSDFFESLDFSELNNVFSSRPFIIGQILNIAPSSEVFTPFQSVSSRSGSVSLYRSNNRVRPSTLQNLMRPGISKEDLNSKVRLWKLINGFSEGRGYLIDAALDLAPEMYRKMEFNRVARGQSWWIPNLESLRKSLASDESFSDLPLKLNPSLRYSGVTAEEYLRQISIESFYPFSMQGTGFFHDLSLHLFGILVLPPKVIEEFSTRSRALLEILDGYRKEGRSVEAIDKMLVEVRQFSQEFDEVLFGTLELFLAHGKEDPDGLKSGLLELWGRLFRLGQEGSLFNSPENIGPSLYDPQLRLLSSPPPSSERMKFLWDTEFRSYIQKRLGPSWFE